MSLTICMFNLLGNTTLSVVYLLQRQAFGQITSIQWALSGAETQPTSLGGRERKTEAAWREYGAAEAFFPGNIEMKFWHAVSLVNAGRVEDSLPLFKEIFAADRN